MEKPRPSRSLYDPHPSLLFSVALLHSVLSSLSLKPPPSPPFSPLAFPFSLPLPSQSLSFIPLCVAPTASLPASHTNPPLLIPTPSVSFSGSPPFSHSRSASSRSSRCCRQRLRTLFHILFTRSGQHYNKQLRLPPRQTQRGKKINYLLLCISISQI